MTNGPRTDWDIGVTDRNTWLYGASRPLPAIQTSWHILLVSKSHYAQKVHLSTFHFFITDKYVII